MDLTAAQKAHRRSANKKALIILAILGVLYLGWSTNTFDNFLWRVGLNHSTCVQNGFGATFCGDDAKKLTK